MADNVFRPVDFWKSAVMTMPDTSFFELMRSVFGKIKTPFNKQQLINDLETFLLREDIQKTIAGYIDQNDIKIIAAIAVLNEPSAEKLEAFFEGELNCAQLQDIIVNLEERFILYRFSDESPNPKGSIHPKIKFHRLALNPALEQTLLPFTEDTAPLFPQTPVKTEISRHFSTGTMINDRILAGLFSFVSRNEPFYKSEGVIRKKIIEMGKICFPDTDLHFLLGTLQVLGLFYVDKDNLVPDKKHFDDFSALSSRERSEYCASALIAYNDINSTADILPPLFRNRIRETSNFIHCFLDLLEADFLYPKQFLKRLIEILKQKKDTAITSDKLIEVLEETGLLITESQKYKRISDIQTVNSESPLIAIDSGSSVIVYPEINFADALALAAIMNIQEARILKDTCILKDQKTAGEVIRFEIDKDSIIKAFDKNIKADEIIDLLKRLSCNRVDDALIWNLKDWEKRYSEVSLKKGVVLTLSEDKRYLVKTMPLEDLISETLAPGVYLLPESAADKAADALQAAGIDIIARSNEKPVSGVPANKYFSALPSEHTHSPAARNILPVSFSKPLKRKNEANSAALIENFQEKLKKLSMSETGRTELSARINRRLILCESQIEEANIRYEKLEARHMDYAGKQNIAKQAVAQKSPVEIVWRNEGKEKSLLCIPAALEKENSQQKGGGELVLVVNSADAHFTESVQMQNEDGFIRIPLAKISLLRRIKKSIFEA